MKFYCDSCQTKYSIADEKVRGKVLKVRCKKCSHIITVREASRPAAAAPPAAPGARTVAWHYAINGQSFGPMAEEVLRQKVASGEVGDAAYLWNETFGDWKPLRAVAEFADALAQAQAVKPSPRTIGVKEALSAVSAPEDAGLGLGAEPSFTEAEPSEAEDDATVVDLNRSEVLKAAAARQAASADKAVEGFKASLESTGEGARKDRLAKLRERLHLDEDEAEEEDDAATEPAFGGDDAQPDSGMDFALGDTLDAGDDAPQTHSEPTSEHDGLFGGFDVPSATTPAGAQPQQKAQEGDAQEDQPTDAVPFFPSAPRLGDPKATSSSRLEEITGSLLIQLNSIKKDSRKRMIFFGAAALVLVCVIGGVGYVVATSESTEVVDTGPKVRFDNLGQAPKFNKYSKEQAARATSMFVIEEDIVISREEGRAAFEQEEEARKAGKSAEEIRREQIARAENNPRLLPKIDANALRFEGGSTEGAQIGRGTSSSGINRDGVGATAGGFEVGGLAGAAEANVADDRFQRMAALKTESNREIYRPHAELEAGRKAKGPQGLSPEEVAQGFRTVSQSIGLCRERHMWRGGTIDARRIHLTLQVLNTGRIGRIKLEPDSLEGTEFSRCMNTHRDRWSFPSFNGEPIEVRAPFVLQ
ncbi:GYF domain-containing protein [Lujinxingia vulgaris]|uniref:GYF domain-containing protein n=1 Tax=Lujinxingia vulgaris TaxID=2600176 RepID=UPI001E408408|nr:GYF domain-containing protein [Lujinxingia vulgaris]